MVLFFLSSHRAAPSVLPDFGVTGPSSTASLSQQPVSAPAGALDLLPSMDLPAIDSSSMSLAPPPPPFAQSGVAAQPPPPPPMATSVNSALAVPPPPPPTSMASCVCVWAFCVRVN